jgi:hypothetical protein
VREPFHTIDRSERGVRDGQRLLGAKTASLNVVDKFDVPQLSAASRMTLLALATSGEKHDV